MKRRYWTPDAPMPELTWDERQSMIAQIKDKIAANRLTQVWLIKQLGDRGLTSDKYELSSILAGTRNGAKCEEIIRRSLDILCDYEERLGVAINGE